jgi:hypothetical protein
MSTDRREGTNKRMGQRIGKEEGETNGKRTSEGERAVSISSPRSRAGDEASKTRGDESS